MNTFDSPNTDPGPFPFAVHRAVAARLGVPRLDLRPLSGGTNERTFRAEHGAQAWVVRIEPSGGVQLQRAAATQTLAQRAGVATPVIVAAQLDPNAPDGYLWLVEEWRPGVHFEPMAFEPAERNALSADLGRQLRALHTVVVDSFGIIPPDPWGITRTTYAAWIDREAARVAWAVEHAGMDRAALPLVLGVYAQLRDTYIGRPRLCHGDCATTNILVDQGRVVALIDWEWATGGDPAANIAYWAFWQEDLAALDALLAGYQPDDPEQFRARVLAYRVVTAVDLIHVYAEHGSAADVRFCGVKLVAALHARLWEQ